MSWVREFYARQAEWTSIHLEPIGSGHREWAQLVDTLATSPSRVLELGCGGGQTAAAIADLGHKVLAIELVPAIAQQAQTLAKYHRGMNVMQGDFHTISLPAVSFDIVCYFDGFGVGSDDEQKKLLSRIRRWLEADGNALIEIYSPGYWRHAAGTVMKWEDCSRRYGYEEKTQRMLDTWWQSGDEANALTQSLRCSAPNELPALLDGTGLRLARLLPGGAFDHTSGVYRSRVLLDEAMQYTAILHPEKTP